MNERGKPVRHVPTKATGQAIAMAPIVPDPKKIKSFKNQAAFAAWLGKNHARETEIWLKVHKKNKMNLFALACRTNSMKTPAGRAKKIADLVAMLARGETIVPERPRQ